MYRFLLCWRYLRTRWIALASIVSVTLGVATLIVVNSVMDGFTLEMRDRIHGILGDIVVRSHASAGIQDPHLYEQAIREKLGDRLSGTTTVVCVPAMLTFSVAGQSHTQKIDLIGIDSDSYTTVSDFSGFLMHPENRAHLGFALHETGYAPNRPGLQHSGWQYRRDMARARQQVDEERERNRLLRQTIQQIPSENSSTNALANSATSGATNPTQNSASQLDQSNSTFGPPSEGETTDNLSFSPPPAEGNTSPGLPTEPPSNSTFDPSMNPTMASPDTLAQRRFNPMKEIHTGIVLGIGIGSTRYRNREGKVEDHFFIRPGDDVSVTFPNAGSPPRAVDTNFTVVDMYESKMSEYDSTFCFVSLRDLQRMRGMIDPITSNGAVSSVQIKLKPGVDLDAARDDLRALFPPESMLVVESWRDSQGPLLAAVQLETTLLNILLFMIIAVAGFGILATFFMIVVEKTRDIGVLKALGAPGRGIASIFLGYGLLLGAVGSGVGALLGLLFVWNINGIAKIIERITGREVFDPTVYYFNTIPTVIHPIMIVWVVTGAMLIAVLASVLPSIRAARMHPVEALRYE